MKCNKHRGYKALRRPLSNCQDCWTVYIESVEQKAYQQGKQDAFKLFESLKQKISEGLSECLNIIPLR